MAQVIRFHPDKKTQLILVFVLIICVQILSIFVYNQEQYLAKYDPAVQQFVVKYFSQIPYDTEGPYGFWLCKFQEKLNK